MTLSPALAGDTLLGRRVEGSLPPRPHADALFSSEARDVLARADLVVLNPAEAADVVPVTPRWGPNMTSRPPRHIRAAAQQLLAAGATLVAGHSAHVFHGVTDRVLYDMGSSSTTTPCTRCCATTSACCSWSRSTKLTDPPLVAVAEAHGRSTAQVLIRWALQHGLIVLPKSTRWERIAANADVFDFTLTSAEMAALDALDENLVTGWDPTTAP